ncbi:MAG TPA: GNAT family N-acetyltransferase [Gemmatimonadaceae bacterium]
MISHRDLMQLHVEALFTHDAAGDIVRVNEPGGARAPRFFLGLTVDGAVLRFRDDVDHDTRRELRAASERDVGTLPIESLRDPSRFEIILARGAPIEKTWTGPAFCFPQHLPSSVESTPITDANATLLRAHFEGWVADVQSCQPMFAAVVDGHALALGCSVRRTSEAHEAGVETAPAYRGRGYASQTVAAWAGAVREMNRVPLYSTSWDNDRSQAVARKLGLILFGADMHIT